MVLGQVWIIECDRVSELFRKGDIVLNYRTNDIYRYLVLDAPVDGVRVFIKVCLVPSPSSEKNSLHVM